MIPKRLKMENFLSHNISEIDFDKFDVALILGKYGDEADQSNGAGKTAIFCGISWALFGKSRHKKKNGVVKWDKTSCRVEFEFVIDGETFLIKRLRDKTINDSDVGFFRWSSSNQNFEDISCDTNTATDKKILRTINVNYDVFINSVYFKQNDISIFAQNTPGRRKDVLKSLLRMDKWDKYQSKAKEHGRKASASIKEKERGLIPIEQILTDISKCEDDILNIKNETKKSENLYKELSDVLVEKRIAFQSVNSDDIEEVLKELEEEYTSIRKRLKEIFDRKSDNDTIIGQNNAKISELQQKISIFKDQIKQAKSINISDLRSKTAQGRAKSDLLKEEIKELAINVSLTNECDRCKKPLTKKDIVDIQKRRKEELAEARKRQRSLDEQLKKAEEKLKVLEKTADDGAKAQIHKGKAELKLSSMKNTINEKMDENKRLIEEQARLSRRDYKKEIDELKSKCGKEYQEKLEKEIRELENDLRSVKTRVDSLNVEYGSLVRRRTELVETEKSQIKLQKEIDSLKSEFAIYDKLRECFGKDGIQSVIIENIIEELENYANDTLSKMCNEPTSISIQTQRQNDNGSWTETFDIVIKAGSRVDEFETYSGGEQFRVSLALRLALSNILSKRMGGVLNFLLLDEVSSNLDNKGLDMFINIVKKLGDSMKVLVITHNEKLKDKFDDILMVNKSANGRSVTLQ